MRKKVCLLVIAILCCGALLTLAGCSAGGSTALSTAAAQDGGGAIEVSLIVPAAQSKGSKISDGYVALAGATVSVVGQNKSAVTDAAGYAKITGLAAGTYTVTVGKEGYETVTYTNVSVSGTLTTVVGVSSGIVLQTSTNPGIMDLSATSGASGATITIAGINFGSSQGSSTITFNGTTATTITSWSSSSIVCAVPSGATTGNIVVTVGGATSNGVSFTITTGAPNIDALSPASGTVGASITIFGSNFGSSQGSSTIKFNGTSVTSVTYWSSGQIVCTVPAGATTGNVVVTVGGMASNGASFTITSGTAYIDTLSPASGAVGASVTIYGSNFGSTQSSSTITFNGTSVTGIAYWSSGLVICTVPTGATTGNVVIAVGGTASNGASFTITSGEPHIDALSPSSDSVGASVTIYGSNFGSTQSSSTITFNGTSVTSITHWSSNQIICTVPTGATTGNVVVTVGGTASNGASFTVVVPTISSISPTNGKVGDTIIIYGSNFGTSAGTVKFYNNKTATVTSWSSIQIVCTVPTGTTTGPVKVTVNGQDSNTVTFATTINMVLCPAVTYSMGQEGYNANELPVHTVNLSAFYIGKYEITNTDFCTFLNSAGNLTEGEVTWWDAAGSATYNGIVDGSPFTVRAGFGNKPVAYVSWYGAVAYCNWKSDQEGLNKCYGGYQADGLARWGTDGANFHRDYNGYRLPTEAEWEYACRGNPVTSTIYYWGDVTIIDAYCWYTTNSGNVLHNVGLATPNNLGLYDMNGNVWEWCTDWYGAYGAGPDTNPRGPDTGSARVLRGGGWYGAADNCRSAYRGSNTPGARNADVGFRLVRTY